MNCDGFTPGDPRTHWIGPRGPEAVKLVAGTGIMRRRPGEPSSRGVSMYGYETRTGCDVRRRSLILGSGAAT